MTMTTPRGPESTVLRMVANAMHIQNIEVETGWTPDEIKAVAMRNGYALDAASRRFRRAPQPKPAPVGIVRTSQTSTGAADTGLPASDPRHCPPTNPTCTWDACIEQTCKATVDRVTGKHSHPLVSQCQACGTVERRPQR